MITGLTFSYWCLLLNWMTIQILSFVYEFSTRDHFIVDLNAYVYILYLQACLRDRPFATRYGRITYFTI